MNKPITIIRERKKMSKPIITIIRGLPGSGKTSLGRKLSLKTGAMLIEPDMLLTRGGDYRYDPVRYQFATAAASELLRIAAKLQADVIYADVLPRVITVLSLLELYQAASQAGATQQVIDCKPITVEQSIRRNSHHVKPEDIRRMADEWQPWKP